MHFLLKIPAKILITIAALYALSWFFANFVITGGWRSFVLGGIVLALINLILRPILKIVSFPLILITFGLFNIVINIIILLVADHFLLELTISGFWTLVWGALVIGIANSLF